MFSPHSYLFILLSNIYLNVSDSAVHGVNTYKPSAGQVEARIQGQLHGDFKDSLGHIIFCLKQTNKETKNGDSFKLS